MKTTYTRAFNNLILHQRWPWHLLFWSGYALFRAWVYFITVKYYSAIYLEYMLLSEMMFVVMTYFTLWLYKRLFEKRNYLLYFAAGAASWMIYLYGRTIFQLHYLRQEKSFQGDLADIFISNLTFVLVCFLFITSCKYFKDGFIRQHFESERKEQQLIAENNNLKSQIAPHFLFNTLNNLYGLAVDKSDKLPGLMLRLSDLLRHSLYETQKQFVTIHDEINVIQSYIELETVRLEDDLNLEFQNLVDEKSPFQIAPLILIVFIENAFKHAKFVQSAAVQIYIRMTLDNDWFTLKIQNNYNPGRPASGNGIGLANVKRRLEVLYPNQQYHLSVHADGAYYTTTLELKLTKSAGT